MGRRVRTAELDIPADAWTVKPWFPDFPNNELIDEIRQHLRSGEATYSWRGHTHTAPPKGANIEYLAEFDLPKEKAAPCPICSPRHRKFFKRGLVAWFPDTATISLIGPDCFRELSGGHDEAMARFRARERAERDRRFLLDNLPLMQEFARVTAKNLNHAKRVEGVRLWVLRVLRDLDIDLWPHVRTGTLYVDEEREEVSQDRNGNIQVRKITVPVPRATIGGYAFFDPDWKRASTLLETALDLLSQCNVSERDIEDMSEVERNALAGRVSKAVEAARNGQRSLAEVIAGTSVATTASLRSWSEAGGPVRFYIRRRPAQLELGRTVEQHQISRPPDGLDFASDPLPSLRSSASIAGGR